MSAKVCEGCGPEPAELIDGNSQKTNPKEKEECPICFVETDNLKQEDLHICKRCKQVVCAPCYQDLLKAKNQSCPLCRYENF